MWVHVRRVPRRTHARFNVTRPREHLSKFHRDLGYPRAAAAAYGLDRPDIAAELTEIAEAAERLWIARTQYTSA